VLVVGVRARGGGHDAGQVGPQRGGLLGEPGTLRDQLFSGMHAGSVTRQDGDVIPLRLARRLVAAGLVWEPAPGDRFCIPDKGMDDEVFVLSTMTIEVHDLPGRTVIGFNGTTEWALDDVDKDATIWLPREDQLRELLGASFHRLERAGNRYRVVVTIWDEVVEFTGDEPDAAYADALLHLLSGGRTTPGGPAR
jgi:hypothetical protein